MQTSTKKPKYPFVASDRPFSDRQFVLTSISARRPVDIVFENPNVVSTFSVLGAEPAIKHVVTGFTDKGDGKARVVLFEDLVDHEFSIADLQLS